VSQLCTVCGTLTSDGPRCDKHPRTSGKGANHAVHTDPRWTRLSQRMIARHVGQYGWICPGDGPEHPAHPTRDLTLDHVMQLQEGGAPFDPANTRVLCRSRNSATGARLANERRAGRVAPRMPVVLDERAQVRARFLG
jgi:5-methylcytosine-specific restriction endonuclease McrA